MTASINLYSDTQTRPTPAMRAAMAEAEVGDEQRRLDPTVNLLQDRVASLLGQEAAVFLPTGTMCNLVAVATHTTPGEAIVVEDLGHILRSETSGAAAVSGVVIHTVKGSRGHFTVDNISGMLTPGSQYAPRTTLLCLEQTHNFAGGTVWPVEQYEAVADFAHSRSVAVHTDGARLFNAAVASGVEASRWGAAVDSIWVDFTKGLGAPIGAVLAGSRAFIEQAWLYKHRFGGAMRQSGIAAAGCLYALDHQIERLADDHANAQLLADGLGTLGCTVTPPDTNIVMFDPQPCGLSAGSFCAAAADAGVEVVELAGLVRAVTHQDVTKSEIEEAVERLKPVLG